MPTMRKASVFSFAFLSVAATAPLFFEAGCSVFPLSDSPTDTTEQASTAEDLALATQVLTLLGGPSGKCKNCHTATPDNIRAWGKAMQAVDAACFAPTTLTAAQRVDCLRDTPTDPASAFSPHKLGLYAAGASFPQFGTIFPASAQYASFRQQAGMPRGAAPLTAAQFTLVKGWVLRGMPQLDQAAGGDAGADSGAGACVDSRTPELAAHLAQMKTQGWGARLADQATPMFGCGASTSALSCLTTVPEADGSVGAPGVTQKIRKLYNQALSSRYWVRSSADGRWVGFGTGTTAKVIDLSKPSAPPIDVAADYDPFFLPNNDGFAFAGGQTDQAIHVCRQSLLADAALLPRPSVSLVEPKCTTLGKEVYESIGTSLDGSRYFLTVGAHENDDGGNRVQAPLPAKFSDASVTQVIPMVNDGAAYKAQTPVPLVMPGEGDVMLSPSTRMLVTRFTGGAKQGGYRVHALDSSGGTIQAPLRAQVCMKGGKAGFSFDERFLVAHQYVDRTEPDQATLPAGSSNIVMADLATGAKVRLTQMAAGQYALYPHFRADGWVYFLVRDMNARVEYVAATDAAVRMGKP